MSLSNSTSSKSAAVIFNGIIFFIILLFFIGYFTDLGSEITIIIAILLVTAIAILVLRFKQLLLYSLSFLIPLSVPQSIFGESRVNVPSELICVMLTGFFFIKLVFGQKPDRRFLSHPITILVLCDLAWLLIASSFSQMPEVSLKRLFIRLCYYVSFYYFYHELFRQDFKSIKKIFTLHVTGFLIPIAYAIYYHAKINFSPVGSDLLSAPFYFDHTIYGACLAFFIPFLISSSLSASKFKEHLFYMLLLLIFIIAVTLSYSRAAWISLLMALSIAAILKYHVKTKYLLCASALVLLAVIFNWQKISDSFKDNKEISHSNDVTMHFKSISNVNTDASNKERINRWKCALRMFADKPLTGFGPGTYQFFYGQYQQRQDLTRISTFNGTKGHAHSEYLNYLSETGLPGLLIFVSLMATVCVKCVQVFKRAIDPDKKNIALYVFTALVTFLIHAFFNGFLEFDKVAMPVFCAMAIVTSLDLQGRNEAVDAKALST